MLNAFKVQDKEHFVSYVQVYKKKSSVLAGLFISSVKLSSLLCGWLPTVRVLNSSISYVLYIWERGDSNISVWNVCFLAMATIERNTGLWEKTDMFDSEGKHSSA